MIESSLAKRVITASILAPLFILLVLFLPSIGVAIIFAFIILYSGYEWCNLINITDPTKKRIYLAGVAFQVFVAFYILKYTPSFIPIMALIIFLMWCIAFYKIIHYAKQQKITSFYVKTLAGLIILPTAWVTLTALHSMNEKGPEWVVSLLLLIWIADSGAYFSGKQWGKRKLAPVVSPGKTWEGVYGAILFSFIFSIASGFWFNLNQNQIILYICLCLITVIYSIIGDLSESVLKRESGLKDSGHLLPGHGGILDRIDSLLAAAPIYYLGLFVILDPIK